MGSLVAREVEVREQDEISANGQHNEVEIRGRLNVAGVNSSLTQLLSRDWTEVNPWAEPDDFTVDRVALRICPDTARVLRESRTGQQSVSS